MALVGNCTPVAEFVSHIDYHYTADLQEERNLKNPTLTISSDSISRMVNSPSSFPVNNKRPLICIQRTTVLLSMVRLQRPVSVYHILTVLLVAEETMYWVLAYKAMTVFLCPLSIFKHFPVLILQIL